MIDTGHINLIIQKAGGAYEAAHNSDLHYGSTRRLFKRGGSGGKETTISPNYGRNRSY